MELPGSEHYLGSDTGIEIVKRKVIAHRVKAAFERIVMIVDYRRGVQGEVADFKSRQ